MEFLRDILSRTVLFSYRRSGLVGAGMAAILVLSPFFLRGLRFESVTPTVTRSGNSLNSLYIKNMKRFGDSSPLIISLLPGKTPPAEFNLLTDRLAEKISSREDILYVDSRLVDLAKGASASWIIRSALLNSGPEVREAFAARFTLPGMRQALRRSRRNIIAAEEPSLRTLIAGDVLGVREFVLPVLEASWGSLNFSRTGDYFEDSERSSRLVFVQPRISSEDAEFARALLSGIAGLIQELKSSVPGTDSVEYKFAGKYALSGEAVDFLQREMMIITLAASLLMLAIIWVSFRRIGAILICFLPVLISLVLVLLLARFLFNPLNYMAMSLAAVVVGLGIDVMVHLMGRFSQMSAKSSSVEEAVQLTIRDCGRPIVIGMMTTAAAFLCLLITEYQAITQFGILTSAGLVIALGVSFFAFPALIGMFGRRKTAEAPLPLFQGFPRRLFLSPLRRPRFSILAAIALVMGGIILARHFSFEMDLRGLLPRKLQSIQTSREVSNRYGASFISDLQLTIEAEGLSEGMAAQRRIDDLLAGLVREKKIASYQSSSLYLPYEELEPSVKSFLLKMRTTLEENKEAFFGLLAELQFKLSSEHEQYYRLIEQAFSEDIGLDALRPDELPPRLKKFLAFEDGRVYLQTYAWPGNDLDNLGGVKEVSQELLGLSLPRGTAALTTGTFQVFDQIIRTIRADFYRVSFICFAVIIIILFFCFRRVSTVLLCLLPVGSAVAVTLGFIVLAGIQFTPAGIGVTALILGIGIDDAVHIVTRVRGRNGGDIQAVVKEIAPVITLTTLTTAAGFSSLMLASNSLVFSFGAVIAFGIAACLFFTILLVPPLVSLIAR